ncbi:class E sortase [Kitasatospora sp. NPDC092948]|uniref:class E sortase n=1 Tax=Kitasatospora sp. NPDC092948 TaxID=3364088 RepID=UPI003804FAC9
MTAVRPERGVPEEMDEPDGWGVYEPAPERTLQLRLPGVESDPAAISGPDDPAGRRRAQGPGGLGAGTGRRRASGRAAGPRPRRPKERKRVVLARAVGELFITLGVVMLLFVSYQLWWTNVVADNAASAAGKKLEQQWAQPVAPSTDGGAPVPAGTFEPGKGFAIIHIPKLDLTYPIAEGTNKQQVLDKGLVGHYTGTAMPSDPAGNFAVAAHRTTHGQPFREIGKLVPGDKIVVETATSYFTYEVAGGIPETPPTNVTVLQAIPKGSPFTEPGRYMTMTTCTPEFSARGRLIVFGKMVDERPRSQGQPEALTGQH